MEEEAKASSVGLEALAFRLTERLAADAAAGEDGENLIFSPLSIYAALALAAAGARGRTLDELLAVLGAPSPDGLAEFVRGLAERVLVDRSGAGGPRVMFACGVWHDKTRELRPTYRAAAAESYKAEVRAVNFRRKPRKAGKRINRWVAAATNNLIGSILDPRSVPTETDLILASAIYFKDKWDLEPFDKKHTKDDKFYLLDGSAKDVPFMRTWKRQYIASRQGFKVLELRYERGKASRESPSYSMLVFLPDARDGLPGLISDMARTPGFIREHRPRNHVMVGDFRLPKFNLAFSRSVTGDLRDMGLEVAFRPGEADLSDIVEEEEDAGRTLALEHVVHKAVIEANDEGAEAAAVTGIKLYCACPKRYRPTTVDFVADIAFFIIEERSGAINICLQGTPSTLQSHSS